MPLVRIEIVKGHPSEYKKILLQAVHEALVEALSIPDWDRNQRLYEVESDYFEREEGKSDKFSMIELTLFPGRSAGLKSDAIAAITRFLGERLGITPEDVFIIIYEPPLENWGIGGQQASQRRLDYKKQ